jgi:2-iminobutanoate/2-iminopropanoate deaminase
MARRQSFNILGTGHRSPIPLGAKVGNILYSSGINGKDREKDGMPDDPKRQAECMFNNMRTLVETAGGTTEDIVRVTLHLKDRSYRQFIDPVWIAMFPDENSRPARHAVQTELGGGMLMQCEIVAVIG